MIVLDTNVLSALMRSSPDAVVVEWLDRQPADSVWLTSITVFEARFGLGLLPKGRRRNGLERAFDRVLTEDLSSRVLTLDEMAAETAAQIAADRQRAGRIVDLRDTLIAGSSSRDRRDNEHRAGASCNHRDAQYAPLRGTRCPCRGPVALMNRHATPKSTRRVMSQRADQSPGIWEQLGNSCAQNTRKNRGAGPTRNQDESTR